MSEPKTEKWMHSFTINREIEKEVKEKAIIDGQEMEVLKKVKEQQPIVFALKRPNRRIHELADTFFSIKLSEFIRAGMLTKALLLKRYRNDGGALSDADSQYFHDLSSQLAQLEEEHQRTIINLEKLDETVKIKKLEDIIKKKMDVLQALQTLETVNQALFAHTAETKAQMQLNNWWIVHLSYWDQEGHGKFEELFPGNSFDQKMQQWDVFEEERPPYIVEALARLSLAIGLWNSGAQTKEDFEQGEKDYGAIASEVLSNIKVAEETKNIEPSPGTSPLGSTEVTPTN